MDGQVDRWVVGWIDVGMIGWMVGWIDVGMIGWVVGWIDVYERLDR